MQLRAMDLNASLPLVQNIEAEQNGWHFADDIFNYMFLNETDFSSVQIPLTIFLVIRSTHHGDVIMGAITSQITSLSIVNSTVYSGADQRKHQSSASLAFLRGNPRWPVNSPHKWPVTRKTFPFDDVIMNNSAFVQSICWHRTGDMPLPGPF